LCNFGLFLSKFGCHGNSLGSLENLDSILYLYFPTPKTLPYTHKSVSNFLDFCEKIVEIVKNVVNHTENEH